MTGRRSSRLRRLAALAVGLAGALAGCASVAPPRRAPPPALYAEATIPGVPEARFWSDVISAEIRGKARERYLAALRREWRREGRPDDGVVFDILALSGGGPDGAFAAGLLNGWSRNGSRPEFDLVTGISVGALIAPFAFLGPEYDPALRMIFTEFDQDEVVVFTPIAALLGRALGVADTSPLRRAIARLVDEALLARIAEEHRAGRSLLIGTTNIDAGRPVVWNMGAIAEAGDLELFRDVMLASASIPGVFPPVVIDVRAGGERYAEFHVDGGVTHSVITWPSGLTESLKADLPFATRAAVHVVQNNALTPPYDPVEAALPAIATRSLSTLIRGQTGGDLIRIYLSAREIGADFRLVFVPPEFAGASATAFDSARMTALFEAAEADARDGIDWLSRPPGFEGFEAGGTR